MWIFPQRDQFEAAQEDDTSLGNILLEMGYVTPEQLEEAIAIQRSQKKLGSVLVQDMKVLTEDQLDEVLMEQKLRRKKLSRAEFFEIHQDKRRRLMSRVDDISKEVESTSEEVALKMGQLVMLQGKGLKLG